MREYPTRILLATDGSESSRRAARAAVALAQRPGAELCVVHVWQPSTPSSSAGIPGGTLPGESSQEAERRARRLLERAVEEVVEEGGKVAQHYLRVGRPASGVVVLAREIEADMVVVGDGGPRSVRRAFSSSTGRSELGRASGEIVRNAHCPVLVVRGEIFDKEQ